MFVPSIHNSLGCSFVQSVGRSVGCSVGRSGGRSLIRSVVFVSRSGGRFVGLSVGQFAVRSGDRSVGRAFRSSFLCSVIFQVFVRFFVPLHFPFEFIPFVFCCFVLSLFVCLTFFFLIAECLVTSWNQSISETQRANHGAYTRSLLVRVLLFVRYVCSVLINDTFIGHYLFISQCVSFCSDLNSPLPMDIRYWKEVEAAVGV